MPQRAGSNGAVDGVCFWAEEACQVRKRVGSGEPKKELKKGLATITCHNNRFPALQSYVRQYRPPLIIGTGLTAREDFCAAFSKHNVSPKKKAVGDRTIWWFLVNHGRTLVTVIPFLLNPTGLNSHHRLRTIDNALHDLAATNPAYVRAFPEHCQRRPLAQRVIPT